MASYHAHTTVDAGAEVLFGYLADVANLPKYMHAMTSARPAGEGTVDTTAKLGDREVSGQAWYRVDPVRRSLTWGSEGPDDYHGSLTVETDGDRSSVTVDLTTERADGPGIQAGLEETLATIVRLVEAG
jgi:uncharacterized membrane protein